MELSLEVTGVSAAHAIDGMRRPFVRSFGWSWVGRRLADSAWSAFRAALLHGSGIALAQSHAEVAAAERNLRTALVARWTSSRIEHAVRAAVQNAANAT